MKIYKIVELSQGSDYHGAYHHIHDEVVALCVSELAAEQHIEELLRQDYENRLGNWAEHLHGDKPELETNSVWLTEEFNGLNSKEEQRFVIEVASLIMEET
jgi:hypothetical protein